VKKGVRNNYRNKERQSESHRTTKGNTEANILNRERTDMGKERLGE
jgi:hypothetical protein